MNFKNKIAVIVIISSVVLFLVGSIIWNQTLVSDTGSKLNPISKRIAISQQLDYGDVNGSMWMTDVGVEIFDLKGDIGLKSSSRSEQNPIIITAKITPEAVWNGGLMDMAWNIMPETLHYKFSGAIAQPVVLDKFGNPSPAILELKKYNNPPRYEGRLTVVYQDAGEYNFTLVENGEMQPSQNRIIEVPESASATGKAQLHNVITELSSANDEKIKIASYEQTVAVTNMPPLTQIFYTTGSVILVSLIPSIQNRIYKNKKKKQNDS